jgi:hypothetical protein
MNNQTDKQLREEVKPNVEPDWNEKCDNCGGNW